MFSVKCEDVKTKLLERVEEILDRVYKDIERDIIQRSQQIDRRHKEIVSYVTRPLTTAEDVQEMEKYTNNLILEKSVMQDRIDEWRNNLFLLINMDYNITEQTQNLARIVYQWPKKLDKILDDAYRAHYDDRDALEQQMYKTRKQFDKEMEVLEAEVKVLETNVDLFSYPMYIIPIREFYERFQGMKSRKERLEHEEMILLGAKTTYDAYLRFEKFFEPHYLFWTTTEQFLDKKKLWRGSTASTLNIEQIKSLKVQTHNMLKKIKNKLAPEQTKLIEGMQRQLKDVDSWMVIIETLGNPGMKPRHWEQIKQISGPDLDFRKLSIDRIKFLKIEYMIEPIVKISEEASKEYSVELFLKSMEEELEKRREKFIDLKTFSVDEVEELKQFKVSLDYRTECCH